MSDLPKIPQFETRWQTFNGLDWTLYNGHEPVGYVNQVEGDQPWKWYDAVHDEKDRCGAMGTAMTALITNYVKSAMYLYALARSEAVMKNWQRT